MSASGKGLLVGMVALGSAIRLGLAFGLYGYGYDVDSYVIVSDTLDRAGLDMYGVVNAVEPVLRWPYPPGFLPAILGADWITGFTPLPFHGLIQVPAIAADAVLAWIAQAYLGRRGADERTRLAVTGLIALGPVFILISGYHGQIDSVGIVLAVAALLVWEAGGRDRGVRAGVLLGLGAAVKIVPGLVALALLPHARSRREAIALLGTTIAVPVALLAPFAVADPDGIGTLAEYQGAPGQGGLTLALQPGLAEFQIQDGGFALNAPVEFLYENGFVNGLILVVAAILLFRFRPRPALGAALVFLAVLSFGTGFFFHYLIWGLPFLIMAGYLRLAAAIQLLVLVPALLFYLGPWADDGMLYLYVALMLAAWGALLWGLFAVVRRTMEDAPASA